MNSLEEIQSMLIDELWNIRNSIISVKAVDGYYNEALGDTSFLLSGLLYVILKSRDDWDQNKWLDDSLIEGIDLDKNKLTMYGVMIWGTENTTQQWVDPFYFEIILEDSETTFSQYTFLFGDVDNLEISYEIFRINRLYWEKNKRNWKYVICQQAYNP